MPVKRARDIQLTNSQSTRRRTERRIHAQINQDKKNLQNAMYNLKNISSSFYRTNDLPATRSSLDYNTDNHNLSAAPTQLDLYNDEKTAIELLDKMEKNLEDALKKESLKQKFTNFRFIRKKKIMEKMRQQVDQTIEIIENFEPLARNASVTKNGKTKYKKLFRSGSLFTSSYDKNYPELQEDAETLSEFVDDINDYIGLLSSQSNLLNIENAIEDLEDIVYKYNNPDPENPIRFEKFISYINNVLSEFEKNRNYKSKNTSKSLESNNMTKKEKNIKNEWKNSIKKIVKDYSVLEMQSLATRYMRVGGSRLKKFFSWIHEAIYKVRELLGKVQFVKTEIKGAIDKAKNTC